MRSSLQIAPRAVAFVAGILLVTSAVAEEKMSTDQVKVDCLSRAQLHYTIDDAQCSVYPVIAPDFAQCKYQAQTKWANAIAACQTSATGTRPIRKPKLGGTSTAPKVELLAH